MNKLKSLIAALALVLSLNTIGFAQSTDFQKYRFMEIGAEYSLRTGWDGQAGFFFIYGKQRSPIYSQGWGIGVNYFWESYKNTYHGKSYYTNELRLPIFSEWRFNFSKSDNPFFCNIRTGVNIMLTDFDPEGIGLQLGIGVGKSFNLSSASISPFVRGEYCHQMGMGSPGYSYSEWGIGLGVSVRF